MRKGSTKKIYLIGYANGDVGYLPTRAAYAEGGYEVEVAHMFYGGFRSKVGGLELLAAAAMQLVGELQAEVKADPEISVASPAAPRTKAQSSAVRPSTSAATPS